MTAMLLRFGEQRVEIDRRVEHLNTFPGLRARPFALRPVAVELDAVAV
jgi:hypothetical protein